MNNKFDELTKSVAQSVTRRVALNKFSVALGGMALACFGLATKTQAGQKCAGNADCPPRQTCWFGQCRKPVQFP